MFRTGRLALVSGTLTALLTACDMQGRPGISPTSGISGAPIPQPPIGCTLTNAGSAAPSNICTSGGGSVVAPSTTALSPHASGNHIGNISIENIPTLYASAIQAAVTKYNAQYHTNLTVAFIESIIFQESKGDPNAQSQDGQDSEGLMQVSTAPNYDIADKLSPGGDQYDPNTSIDTGTHLLAIMDQCGTVNDPTIGSFYSTFTGACGNLPLLASKFQGGPQTSSVNTYGTQISAWMTSFSAGTQPTNNGQYPIGGKA